MKLSVINTPDGAQCGPVLRFEDRTRFLGSKFTLVTLIQNRQLANTEQLLGADLRRSVVKNRSVNVTFSLDIVEATAKTTRETYSRSR